MFASDRVNGNWLGMYYGGYMVDGRCDCERLGHDLKNPSTSVHGTWNHLLYTGHAVDQRASAARERQVSGQYPHERTSPALYVYPFFTLKSINQRALGWGRMGLCSPLTGRRNSSSNTALLIQELIQPKPGSEEV